MAYSYSTLLTALAEILAVPSTDSDLVALYPVIIDDAEQLLYRELGLLACRVTVNGTATTNSRLFTLPTSAGHLLVVDQINVFDASSVRHPVVASSREFLDFLWPSENAPKVTSIPEIFARISDTTVLFGPAPGAAWTVEVIGTIRPTALSAINTTTFLTTYLSDLFLAACVVSATGSLLKQWSAVADDPQMAVTWVTMFKEKLASAQREELRKTYANALSAPSSSIRSE